MVNCRFFIQDRTLSQWQTISCQNQHLDIACIGSIAHKALCAEWLKLGILFRNYLNIKLNNG
jgi:hypothetical protein